MHSSFESIKKKLNVRNTNKKLSSHFDIDDIWTIRLIFKFKLILTVLKNFKHSTLKLHYINRNGGKLFNIIKKIWNNSIVNRKYLYNYNFIKYCLLSILFIFLRRRFRKYRAIVVYPCGEIDSLATDHRQVSLLFTVRHRY